MIECSMGPRHTSGLSPGLSSPTEITFTPKLVKGSIRFSPSTRGCKLVFIISGTLGPYTSASSRPVRWPILASATARFTATVVLPTPPLPEPTATMFLTPGSGNGPGCGAPCVCPCANETPLKWRVNPDYTGSGLYAYRAHAYRAHWEPEDSRRGLCAYR